MNNARRIQVLTSSFLKLLHDSCDFADLIIEAYEVIPFELKNKRYGTVAIKEIGNSIERPKE